jgi:MFS family permease
MLQALSAVGNVSAALINLGLGLAEGQGLVTSPWRIMFLIGAFPALLALIIRTRLKEPEAWQKAAKEGALDRQLGSYRELFSHPTWRKHALLGLVLASSGVIGLWAIGFYAPDLIRRVQTGPITERVYSAEIADARSRSEDATVEQLERIQQAIAANSIDSLSSSDQEVRATIEKRVNAELAKFQSLTSICINIGAFLGMFCFSPVSQRIGRKPTFAIALLAACISTAVVFAFLQEMWQIFVLVPIMGFCQLSLFGGYAIYFPELFPTRLRSTGTSFCYNVGRFIAALGPLVKIWLNQVFEHYGDDSLRYAGVTMCAVFLVGLLVLPFLPETRGEPLPE